MQREIGGVSVRAVGFGGMVLSHAYGTPPPREEAARLLNHVLDLGYDHIDTAALYGFGANESLIGEAIGARRDDYFLASKCGMTGVNGVRVIDTRPETITRTLDEALGRLRTDRIDLYYLHRFDPAVPIEESVGALGRMVEAGKVRMIGLSEVSATTLRKAHATYPIAAVQSEYSPWSRNVELGVLAACAEIGATLVAFSPVARGFLADNVHSPSQLPDKDIRKGMPRFQSPNFEANLRLLDRFKEIAAVAGCTPAQLSLGWVLAQGEHVVAIPGTTVADHAAENLDAEAVRLSSDTLSQVSDLFAPGAAHGNRYPAATQSEVDTEEFA